MLPRVTHTRAFRKFTGNPGLPYLGKLIAVEERTWLASSFWQAGGESKPHSPESKNVQSLGRGDGSEVLVGKAVGRWEETRRCWIGLGIGLGTGHGGSVGEYLFSLGKSPHPNSVTATGKGRETIAGSSGLAF